MRKFYITAVLLLASLLCACGLNNGGSEVTATPTISETNAVTATPTPENLQTYSWDEADHYEAEDGKLLGNAYVSNIGSRYFVKGLSADSDGFEIEITVDEDAFYDIKFTARSESVDYKENYAYFDNEVIGTIPTNGYDFEEIVLERIYMEAGTHTVKVMKYWGWTYFDCIDIKKSDEIGNARFNIEPVLVNENATDNAKRLFTYMCDIYGTSILSGQYCDTGMYGSENAAIYQTTGEYPAILGLDFIDYSPSRVANGTTGKSVEQAIAYWEEGGIVTFCWHWNAPSKYITGTWYSAFYTQHTNINIQNIMNGTDTEGYELLMDDIDAIAQQLLILQEAGVPILWRPLHEASGGWFWWGAKGADAYKQLYILLYEKLTYEYGINNLIWVWNGQDADWYPGDEYVDIIGEDIYPGEKVYSPQTAKYLEVLSYTDANKMIVLSENGCLFDPDLAYRDGSMWGYFGTWGGEFVINSSAIIRISEQYTEESMLKKVYTSERVITRSELPDLKNYPISN